MTEAEAREKRCCGPEGCGIVPRSSLNSGRRCVGSNCMAWRWEATKISGEPAGRNPEGYCGLCDRQR